MSSIVKCKRCLCCSECWDNVPSNVPQFILRVVTLMRGVWPGETIFALLAQPLSLLLSLLLSLRLPEAAPYHGLYVHQTGREGTGLTLLFLDRTEVSSDDFERI